jgi:hypothetical protein
VILTSSFPIVSPAATHSRRAPPHLHHRAAAPQAPTADLRQYLADDTDRGRPPPVIGVRTVVAMQWIIFGAVVLRWIFW